MTVTEFIFEQSNTALLIFTIEPNDSKDHSYKLMVFDNSVINKYLCLIKYIFRDPGFPHSKLRDLDMAT